MRTDDVEIEQADSVTEELRQAVAGLIPQLSRTASPPSAEELDELVSSPFSVLFVARASGKIVGMLTLATYRIPTGVHAVIEDVVVDDDARGLGIGSALTKAALDEAARRGARHVDLTSRPSREEANRLYQKMGFVIRETNVYRYSAP